ncbi:hypothetical protein JQ634_13970 [Bradyrhizobium sp. AUGA SZCCT0240]|uniref:hypothetical protein n=1 Tax=unclassified Bradyrhizobium TaxID=2631580 RepID=UPI001BA961C7|nr:MULTISPECIES: hypothetical protein [unclassified Bradyrhizobium]MBR1243317.1 hypothetical protein [Bradyrhizobium sp. AUGA SZCCT0274]MBR1254807.1 hypothetical protein [Bradyrhizobium sp. AUGA SZCCT0240]
MQGNAATFESLVPCNQTFAKRRRYLDRRLAVAIKLWNSIMSAYPSVTIDREPRHPGVEESRVETAGRSDLDSVFVAALYAVLVVPVMTGWLYVLGLSFWKVMIWMIA